MKSRELVYRTLNFDNPDRVPRQLWELPWARYNYPKELNNLKSEARSITCHLLVLENCSTVNPLFLINPLTKPGA